MKVSCNLNSSFRINFFAISIFKTMIEASLVNTIFCCEFAFSLIYSILDKPYIFLSWFFYKKFTRFATFSKLSLKFSGLSQVNLDSHSMSQSIFKFAIIYFIVIKKKKTLISLWTNWMTKIDTVFKFFNGRWINDNITG